MTKWEWNEVFKQIVDAIAEKHGEPFASILSPEKGTSHPVLFAYWFTSNSNYSLNLSCIDERYEIIARHLTGSTDVVFLRCDAISLIKSLRLAAELVGLL